ncbi:condensin complex subunit 2/barren [Terfezia claveryi]|nr:condensin complex subunit 2/barren [Terfezia claveryi]
MHRHASPAGVKIPLNDDDAEKAKRIKKRSMLQEVQIRRQSFKQAGTPRKGLDGESSVEGTPKTPRNVGSLRESLNPITPLRRAPLVVNFEEWMKMANDNKINAQNSWNFALIDYFHDMSLLKEGEGINFQKASCTLDGCVKIYTSRVDSVATETGKLLSGLADSGGTKKREREDDEEDEAGEEDEEGEGKKKKKRQTQRSSEATLAKDFSSLQLKKLELEFSVDPLFKKASADFDEGGAKGLLLNHLSIDNKGRIVFDSSDDVEDVIEEEADDQNEVQSENIDINRLRQQFFLDLNELDELDVCPSLKTYDLGDPSGSLDIPFLKATLEDKNGQGEKEDDANSPGYDVGGFDDDDDDFGLPGADGTMAFGDGGVVWADKTLADAAERFLTPSKPRSVYGDDDEGDDVDGRISEIGAAMGVSSQNDDILSYFDEALKKNWAGPEHWKIRRIKDNTKPAAVRPRKEKEAFEINFMSADSDVTQEMLLPQSNTQINLPKAQRKSKTRHLLPDDKHFNSRNLIQLFIKPNALFGPSARKRGPGGANGPRPGEQNVNPADVDIVEMNEEFWAKQQMEKEQANDAVMATGNYDANFFNDDGGDMLPPGLNDVDDDDGYGVGGEAFEAPLPMPGAPDPPLAEVPPATPFSIFPTQDPGTQMITANRRIRPEYVQYAKVAKKVDVRRLKENIWKELGMDMPASEPPMPPSNPTGPIPKKFTDVIHNLQRVYPKNAMSDISTSYCFICVLHLANEKGLVLESNETMTDLRIEKDLTANGPDEF